MESWNDRGLDLSQHECQCQEDDKIRTEQVLAETDFRQMVFGMTCRLC